MRNILTGQKFLLLCLIFMMSCAGSDQAGLCKPKKLYLSITSHAIAPPLVTEFSLNDDGRYWLYRNVQGFDTIRGNLNEDELAEITEQSSIVDLPTQNDIVSDAGIYQLSIRCLNGSSKTATYEGLLTLPVQTKEFIAGLEELVYEIGKANE